MAEPVAKLCRLHELLGRVELCAAAACPLWDPGDATHEGRCAIADLDLDGRPHAAAWLLRIRTEFETARSSEEKEAASRHFAESRDLIMRVSLAPRRH